MIANWPVAEGPGRVSVPRKPTKREQNKAETRARLMAAARKEFARQGFAGTTLRSITSQAGVTTGAFYNNFRDKKEIYLAIIEEISQRLKSITEEAIRDFLEARLRHPKDNPTLELLRGPIARILEESFRERDLFEILRRDGLGRSSEFSQYYRKLFQEFIDPLQKGLEEFIEAGFSRPYNTGRLAQATVNLLFYVVLYAPREREGDLDGWADTIAAMVHGGAKQLSVRRPLAAATPAEPAEMKKKVKRSANM
jgi:AcrR family transcriptional regulator